MSSNSRMIKAKKKYITNSPMIEENMNHLNLGIENSIVIKNLDKSEQKIYNNGLSAGKEK